MVTRLPGTFGSAYDAIGSTLSSGELSAAVAQSGARAPETLPIVIGSVLPIASALASPPTIASAIERDGDCRGATAKFVAIMLTSPRCNQDAAATAAACRFAGVQR